MSLSPERRRELQAGGILAPNVSRYAFIYGQWRALVDGGIPRMEAYRIVGERCYTCEDNVRKIVADMGAEMGKTVR